MDRQTFLDLIPAYALGALDPDEREAFEAMLANDTEAQRLLAEYQALADLLVFTTPVRPAPSHLTQDLRERLAARRQSPPLTTADPPAAPAVQVLPPSRSLQRLLALAALLAAVLGVVWFLTQRPAPERSAQALYEQLVAQEDALRVALAPADDQPQVAGELVAEADGRTAVIRVSGLPVLSDEQTFQLWKMDSNSKVSSAGLFRQAPGQEVLFLELKLDDSIRAYQAFGVSIEPAGGSPFADRPTGPRVFAVSLTA